MTTIATQRRFTVPHPARLLAGVALLLIAPFGHAQLAPAADLAAQAAPTAHGVIGAGLALLPRYQGADHKELVAVPLLEYHWDNGVFIGGDNNALLGYQAAAGADLQYGVAISADDGRRQSHAHELNAMGNVKRTPISVAFISHAITPRLSVNSSIGYGAGNDRKGGWAKLGAAYLVPINDSTSLSFTAGASVANGNYMQTYFGVDAAQAARSGRAQNTQSGGWRDATVGVRLAVRINRDWSMLAALSNTTLSSAARDSALVRQANAQKLMVGAVYALK